MFQYVNAQAWVPGEMCGMSRSVPEGSPPVAQVQGQVPRGRRRESSSPSRTSIGDEVSHDEHGEAQTTLTTPSYSCKTESC